MPETNTVGRRLIRASKVLFEKRSELAQMPAARRAALAQALDGMDGAVRTAVADIRAGNPGNQKLDEVFGAADGVHSAVRGAIPDADADELRAVLRDIRSAAQLVDVRSTPAGDDQLGKLHGAAAPR